MANIYNLKNELLDIFAELEENGGELTPEIEAALKVNQETAKEKISDYSNVIKMLKADISEIDREIKRLNELKNRKKKTIEQITQIVVEALDYYGETSKSGTKFLDYGTGKVSTRTTTVFETNNDNLNGLIKSVISSYEYLHQNNQLDVDNCLDMDLFRDAMANNKQRIGEEEYSCPVNITQFEVDKIDAKFSFTIPLNTMFNGNGYQLMKYLTELTSNYEIAPSVDKNMMKKLASSNSDTIKNIGYCKQNVNITIK